MYKNLIIKGIIALSLIGFVGIFVLLFFDKIVPSEVIMMVSTLAASLAAIYIPNHFKGPPPKEEEDPNKED